MEPLEEKEKMPTLGTGKNNSGFTLIELLVVLILIGISSSYLMLNTNLVNIFNSSDDAPENFFQYMSDESILKGRTLHWFLTTNEEGIYMDEYLNDASLLQSNHKGLLDMISSDTEVTIRSAQGIDYRIDQDISPAPMLSFYPSGETSGAIITMDSANGTYKIIVRTNGEIEKAED